MTKSAPELLDFIKQKSEEIKQAHEALVKELQPKFSELFIPFFKKHPKINKIFWTQYTPYFNDGDTCEFSVGYLEADVEGLGEEDYEGNICLLSYAYEEHTSEWSKKRQEEIRPVVLALMTAEEARQIDDDFQQLKETFKKIPEDTMKSLFGDHAKIVVTPAGLEVEEYDHD